MSEPAMKVLLVDPDVRTRALVATQLATLGCEILQASDGTQAMRILSETEVKLVVTELYLRTGARECLIQEIRSDRTLRATRTLAHTHRCLATDREWAMQAGADAFLIKPTRAERMRYVVGRLATTRGANATVDHRNKLIDRRDSLDQALGQVERGAISDVSCIVFGRSWWEGIPREHQRRFRQRARAIHVSLRSDSRMANHFVEVRRRERTDVGLSTERPESPYRRQD